MAVGLPNGLSTKRGCGTAVAVQNFPTDGPIIFVPLSACLASSLSSLFSSVQKGPASSSVNSSPRTERQPHVYSAASPLSREESTLAVAPGINAAVTPSLPDDDGMTETAPAPHSPPTTVTGTTTTPEGAEGGSRPVTDIGSGDGGSINQLDANSGSSSSSSNGNDNSISSISSSSSNPSDNSSNGDGDDDAVFAGVADTAADGAADGGAADDEVPRNTEPTPLPLLPASLAARAMDKAAKAWTSLEVGMERAIHVRREVKAVFSSELERCLLKVRPACA